MADYIADPEGGMKEKGTAAWPILITAKAPTEATAGYES